MNADVIIEKNGKYWGEYGWIDNPELAFQYDSRFAKKPLDCVSPCLLNREKLLQGARFVELHSVIRAPEEHVGVRVVDSVQVVEADFLPLTVEK